MRALTVVVLCCLASSAWAQTPAPQPSDTSKAKAAPVASPPRAATSAKPANPPAEAPNAQPKPTASGAGAVAPSIKPAASAPAKHAVAPPNRGAEGAQFLVRLRELQARVDELKEEIRRSHARLSLLSDSVLAGGVGGARAAVRFQNEMSTAFRVTRVLVLLDGVTQYDKTDDSGALAMQREVPVFSGAIAPGDHTLQVSVKLRGHGYGIFSYLRGFTFDLKDELSFSVAEGKTIEIAAMVWEKGGASTAIEQRPALKFVKKLHRGSDAESAVKAPAGAVPRATALPRASGAGTGAGAP